MLPHRRRPQSDACGQSIPLCLSIGISQAGWMRKGMIWNGQRADIIENAADWLRKPAEHRECPERRKG